MANLLKCCHFQASISVLVVVVAMIPESLTSEIAGFAEECRSDIPCNAEKGLKCRFEIDSIPDGIGTCQCVPGFTYVRAHEGCLGEPKDSNDWECVIDAQCRVSELGHFSYCDQKRCSCRLEGRDGDVVKDIVRFNNHCYLVNHYGETCIHDAQCEPAKNLSCVIDDMGSGTGHCGCNVTTHWSYFDPKSSSKSCWPFVRPFQCHSLEDCEAAMGDLAVCDAGAGNCTCSDKAGFYQGRCYIQKNVGESCAEDGECRAGGSLKVNCDISKKICLVPTGGTGISSTTTFSSGIFIFCLVFKFSV